MSDNKEIFEGKTFQDLTKDIYENTTKRKVHRKSQHHHRKTEHWPNKQAFD